MHKTFVLFCKSSVDIVLRQREYTMAVRTECYRNLLAGEVLQWVSRMCCLLCVGRCVDILLTVIHIIGIKSSAFKGAQLLYSHQLLIIIYI